MLKVVELSEFFSQFCVQPYHSPGAGAERLRGKGPMESRLVRSVGSRGPAGGVMGSVIVPAVWIGWGVKGWGEKPWKKGRGGDTSITCAPSDPSLPLSLHGQTHCLRGGAHFHRQMHIPLLCSRQHSLLFLSCRNLIATIASLMHFSFICHCQKNSIFSLKKKMNPSLFLLCFYVWSRDLVRRY